MADATRDSTQTFLAFTASLADAAPAPLDAPLAGLWWAAKGD